MKVNQFRSFLILGSVLAALCTACAKQDPPPKAPDYKVTATVREVMASMVMPSADALWTAVSSTTTAKGIEEKAPKTEQDWKDVRGRAITLQEASDLILIPGRHVAASGQTAQDPKVQLSPEQIEALINQDRDTWTKMSHDLHDSVLPALKAIDEKNATALSDAGEGIDKACEGCHLKYWYPKDAAKK